MSMKRLLLVSLALTPVLCVPAAAETLEEAMVTAHANNPNMEEARLAVRAAREDRMQARAAYLPSLGISGSYGANHVESDTVGIFGPSTSEADLEPSTASAQLTQPLLTGGRRGGQTPLANAAVEGAQQDLRGREQDVLLGAANAYLSVLRDEKIVQLSEQHVTGLERLLAGTRRRLEVGEVSRTDVAQAQTRLAGARAALARARADGAASRANYEAIVGVAPDGLTPVGAPPQIPHTLEEALNVAEATHPDLGRARSDVRAARARVSVERAALLPQVSLVGRYDHNEDFSISEPRRESSSAVAQFSMPLFEGGYAWSRTRQGRINVERAEAVTEARRREVVANVSAAWHRLAASREVLQAAREQVEASVFAVEGAERERGLGLRSTLEVLDAQEEARAALIAEARAEADAIFGAYALLAACGALSLEAVTSTE
jgi:outer membrane protein